MGEHNVKSARSICSIALGSGGWPAKGHSQKNKAVSVNNCMALTRLFSLLLFYSTKIHTPSPAPATINTRQPTNTTTPAEHSPTLITRRRSFNRIFCIRIFFYFYECYIDGKISLEGHDTGEATLLLLVLGNQKGHVQGLFIVQARVAMGLIPIQQFRIQQLHRPTNTLCHTVAG